ncbi:unnamed protein product, partial [marine sediment metagenome]
YVNIAGMVEIMAGDYESAHIAADEDGSLAERLEQIQEAINVGAGTGLPADTSIYDAMGTPTLWTATASAVGTLTDASLIDQAGLYVGEMVVPLSGNMAGQGRYITAYDGTQTITVLPAWPVAPGNVDFVIMPSETSRLLLALGAEYNGAPDLYDTIVSGYTTAATAVAVGSMLERLQLLQQASIVKNTIWTASGSAVTTLTAAALLDVAGAYVGQMVIPLAGNMEGHGRYISAYDGTQTITVTPPWAADPGLVDFIIVPSDLSIVYEAIAGAAGILAWPAAAVPAANVSLA